MRQVWHDMLRKLLASGVCLSICAGCNPASDVRLRTVFNEHREGFNTLAAMATVDTNLQGIGIAGVRPEALTQERWSEYTKLLRQLGIREGFARRADVQFGLFFYEECTGSAISRDCKGYAFLPTAPRQVENNLDSPAPSVKYEKLSEPAWYLFRDGG